MGISDTVAARCSSAVDNACIVLSNYQATIMISLQLSAINHILFFISEIFTQIISSTLHRWRIITLSYA